MPRPSFPYRAERNVALTGRFRFAAVPRRILCPATIGVEVEERYQFASGFLPRPTDDDLVWKNRTRWRVATAADLVVATGGAFGSPVDVRRAFAGASAPFVALAPGERIEPFGDEKQAAYNSLAIGLARIVRTRLLSSRDAGVADLLAALNDLLAPFEGRNAAAPVNLSSDAPSATSPIPTRTTLSASTRKRAGK